MIYYEVQNLYLEHISEKTLKSKLDMVGDIFYAFILHDKDLKSNGDLKKPHYHLIIGVELDNKHAKKEVELISNDLYEKTMVKNVRNLQNAICYLIHKKDKNKYQYKFEDIITNDFEVVDELINNFVPKSTNTELMLNDFIDYLSSLDRAPSYIALMKWFKEHNSLNYFIQHNNQINQLVDNYFVNLHYFDKQLEKDGIEEC